MDKQIEEIAEVIRVDCGECNTCKYLDELHCADLLSAEKLYNAGYRKIPENAVVLTEERLKAIIEEEYKKALKGKVVLTREELERVYETERANIRAEIADAGTSCHWCERQIVKDTAKEIWNDITSYYFSLRVIGNATVELDKLAEFWHKRGVEVE